MDNKKISQQINNVVADNIEKLKTIFPNVVKDGVVDFKALELELREVTEEETNQKERYDFTWAGKTKAKKKAQEDIYCKTLNYIEGDGKDEDTTQNLYIEGDNLEVLKLLRQNYYGAIKMIYIDPPYNKDKDFIYNDKFKCDSIESDIKEGIRNEDGARLEQNTKSSNRYHAKWLNMMYPRLKIARDLLTEDGVIFISVDDNEQANLKKICDEIFGEENFVTQLVWTNKEGGGSSDSKMFKIKHEYILCYSKNIYCCNIYGIKQEEDSSYNYEDEFISTRGKYKLIKLNSFSIQYSQSLDYPIQFENEIIEPTENGKKGCWRWSKSKFEWGLKNGFIVFKKGQDGKTKVYTKQYFNVDNENNFIERTLPPLAVIDKFSSTMATKQLEILMNSKSTFSYSKPIFLIKWLIERIALNKDDIILDFFSGSATTAHAVMQLNAEDGGNRKYIMVQIPELCDEKTEAYKNGYKNICEIGKERIRRAGAKILEENKDKEGIQNLDVGFKVFRVANTNIKWNNIQNMGQLDVNTLKDTPDQLDFILNAKDKDIVYEIMLRQKNIPLTSKLVLLDNIGSRTYLYANLYLICLETNITDELIEKISQLNPLPRKFIFRDSAFGEDCARKEKTFRLLHNLINKNYGEYTYNVEFI